jgi:hypothetical protein
MSSTDAGADRVPAYRPLENLVSALILSCVLAVMLYAAMFSLVNIWDVLAFTRFLDLLINAGIVAYTDADLGFVVGLPDLKYYFMSQDPVDWRLVIVALGLLALFEVIKAIQFHNIAKINGIGGSFADHARAYMYGSALDRYLPFHIGDVGAAAMLSNQGAALSRAARVLVVAEAFVLFEIGVFAAIGLALLGWGAWAAQLFWALLMLGAFYAIMRVGRVRASPVIGGGALTSIKESWQLLAQRPAMLTKLCLLSVLAFWIVDVTVYVVSQAFTSPNVLLNYEVPYIIMAVVGGYIARLIRLTPGGIAQFELGFASTLYVGRADLSVGLITVAILIMVMRYFVGTGMLVFAMTGRVEKPNLLAVLNLFSRSEVFKEAPFEQEVTRTDRA